MNDYDQESMSDYISDWLVTPNTEDSSMDDRSTSSNYCVPSIDLNREPGNSEALFEGVQRHDPLHPRPSFRQIGIDPQPTSECLGTGSAVLYQDSELLPRDWQGRPIQAEYSGSIANNDQAFSTIEYHQQYRMGRGQAGTSLDLINNSDIRPWRRHDGLEFGDVGCAAGSPKDHRQASTASVPYQNDPPRSCESSAPYDTPCSISAVGPDHLFFPGVLGRPEDYQETLGWSTARLMDRLDMESGLVNPASDNTDPRVHDAPIPQPLSVIQAQWPYEHGDGGRTAGFRYIVRPNTPVLAAQTRSVSCSGLALSSQLRPSAGSQISEAPSPTETDVSGDTLSCPFEECNTKYTGIHRKGNLGRHRRQKHAGQIVQYECEFCTRTFQRTDARLKHYRKAHA